VSAAATGRPSPSAYAPPGAAGQCAAAKQSATAAALLVASPAASTAWVRVSLDRTGSLLALRLEQSSGQPLLDEAARQTFRRAQPLPPIPDEMNAPQELVVPVEYYLQQG